LILDKILLIIFLYAKLMIQSVDKSDARSRLSSKILRLYLRWCRNFFCIMCY